MTYSPHRFMDTTLSVEERVHHLMSEMTVDEKIAQLAGIWVTETFNSERQFDAHRAQNRIGHGIGHITRVGAASLLEPPESARLANTIQKFLTEQTRLGIPAIVHEESCAGYMARGATTFPHAIGMAAAWDPQLVEEMGLIIREQMRAVGAHHTLAPVLDVARDPRWGRVEETFGEDPYLIARTGVAYIRGLQGDDLNKGIVTTAKHFFGYSASEGGMNWAPAHIPEREMREVFLFPFMAAIREAKTASVMNAYQELDGIPAGSSRAVLVDLLRDELGFDGVLVSDYNTLNTFVTHHFIAKDKTEAARFGLEAGIDIELPSMDCYGEPLKAALEAGTIRMSLVDESLARVLKMKFLLGLFENPFVDDGQVSAIYSRPEPIALSRRLAQESIVLLKNEGGLLPLKKDLKAIAVIGPSADSVRLLQGGYHYPGHLQGLFDPNLHQDSPNPKYSREVFDWTEHFPPTVTVLNGIHNAVSSQTKVHYSQGCEITGTDTGGFAEAVAVAKQSDVAVVVVGDKSGLVEGCTSGETIDCADLRLAGVQEQLVEAIVASGTPTVVVLTTGRPYAISWMAEHVPAILEAWLPAEQGGAAIADVLFGDANPSGRLPITFPRSVGQVPIFYYHKPSGGHTHWQQDYVDLPTSPLYPFGHGLSYTKFAYSDLKVSPKETEARGTVTISCVIQNSGPRDGDEVVQLYVQDDIGSVTRPVKQLKGFTRLHLKAGEKKTVRFTLDVQHLAFYDRNMNYIVEPGTMRVMVGSSSSDIRLYELFEIVGELQPAEPVFYTPVEIN